MAIFDSIVKNVDGIVPHDDTDSGNPIKVGGKASASLPAAVSDADRVDSYFDLHGRQGVITAAAPVVTTTVQNAITAPATGTALTVTNEVFAVVEAVFSGTSFTVAVQGQGNSYKNLSIFSPSEGGWRGNITAAGIYYVPIAGLANVRANCSAVTGTLTVHVTLTHVPIPLPIGIADDVNPLTVGGSPSAGIWYTHRSSSNANDAYNARMTTSSRASKTRMTAMRSTITANDFFTAFARHNSVDQANGILVSTDANPRDYSKYVAATTTFFDGSHVDFDGDARHIYIPTGELGLDMNTLSVYNNLTSVAADVTIYGHLNTSQSAATSPIFAKLTSVTLAAQASGIWQLYTVDGGADANLYSLPSMLGWEGIVVTFDPASDPSAGNFAIYCTRGSRV